MRKEAQVAKGGRAMRAHGGARAQAAPAVGAQRAGVAAVVARAGADVSAVQGLAAHLGVPLAHDAGEVAPGSLVLVADARGLALAADGLELLADFAPLLPRLAPGNLNRELLVRAARVKGARAGASDVAGAAGTQASDAAAVGSGAPDAPAPPVAVDVTAGLGEDALLLAAAGFQVLMCEHDPVIAALLRDALRRAAGDPALAPFAKRMRLHEGDGVAFLATLAAPPDVVYLDPMFPARRKSAAVKKKFQLLHRLEAPCANPEELLAAALAARPRKVVVKRPVKGELLANAKPHHSLAGKAVRYDVIEPRA